MFPKPCYWCESQRQSTTHSTSLSPRRQRDKQVVPVWIELSESCWKGRQMWDVRATSVTEWPEHPAPLGWYTAAAQTHTHPSLSLSLSLYNMHWRQHLTFQTPLVTFVKKHLVVDFWTNLRYFIASAYKRKVQVQTAEIRAQLLLLMWLMILSEDWIKVRIASTANHLYTYKEFDLPYNTKHICARKHEYRSNKILKRQNKAETIKWELCRLCGLKMVCRSLAFYIKHLIGGVWVTILHLSHCPTTET